MLKETRARLLPIATLALTPAALGQSCLVDYDIAADIVPPLASTSTMMERIGAVAVDGDRLAVAVLANVGATGQETVATIRLMKRDPADGTYEQTASIDVGSQFAPEFTTSAALDLEGDTVLLHERMPDGSSTLGRAAVFYRSIPNNGSTLPAWSFAADLNTGIASINATANVPTTVAFGTDAELVTVNGRVLAYVGDPYPHPSGAGTFWGAVYAYDVTAPINVPAGGFAQPLQVAGFSESTNALRGFGESLAVAAAPGGTDARVIVGSTRRTPSTDLGGDVRFWGCTATVGGGFVHQPVPSTNSGVTVEQYARAGHVAISDEWAFVQVLPQYGPPEVAGWTEVYRRSDAGTGLGSWAYQASMDFEGNGSLVEAAGTRGMTVRTVDINGQPEARVVEIGTDGTSWSANGLVHPGVLGQTISTTGVSGFGGVWSRDCYPGIPYCQANPNSTGAAATTSTTGSAATFANDFGLRAMAMPLNQFGYFLVSDTQTAPVAVYAGLVCLGGTLGRYNQPSEIQSTGTTGEFSLQLDLDAVPQGGALVSIEAGQTWNFQAWYRDFDSQGQNTSNFSLPVEMLFR